MQELTTSLAIDVNKFVDPILQAASAAEAAGSRIVMSLQLQDAGWANSLQAVRTAGDQFRASAATQDAGYASVASIAEDASARVIAAVKQQEESWLSLGARAIPSVLDAAVLVSSYFESIESAALALVPPLVDTANAMVYAGIAVAQGIGGTTGLAVGAVFSGIGVAAVGTTAALMTQPKAWLMAGQAASAYGGTVLNVLTQSSSSLRSAGAKLMEFPSIAKTALSMTSGQWEAYRTQTTLSAARQAIAVGRAAPSAIMLGQSYAKGALVAVGGMASVSNMLLTLAKHNVQVEVQGTSMWAKMANGVLKYGGIASTVAGFLFPPWKAATVAINTSIFTVKLAMTDTGKAALKWVANNSGVTESFAKLKSAGKSMLESLIGPMDSAKSTMAGLGGMGQYIITNWTPIPFIATKIGESIAAAMNIATAVIGGTAAVITVVTDKFASWSAAIEAGSTDIAHFDDETAALKKLAAETERVIGLQTTRSAMSKRYGDMQEDAAAKSGRAEEVSAVANAKTSEKIDELRRNYQKLFSEQINGLQKGESLTSGQLEHMKNMTDAIESQAAAIASGRVTEKDEPDKKDKKAETPQQSDASKSYDQLTEQLNKLKYGEEEAARMALWHSEATDDEVIALLSLRNEIQAVTDANKAKEKSEEMAKQAADKIQDMKDQVDLLSGSATKAEIEMRKMMKAGYSQDAVEEVGQLQAQLDKLREKEDKTKPNKDGKNETIFAGSKADQDAIARAMTGSTKNENKKLEDEATKHTKSLATIAKGIESIASVTHEPKTVIDI